MGRPSAVSSCRWDRSLRVHPLRRPPAHTRQVSWAMRKALQIPGMGHFLTEAWYFEKDQTKLTNIYKKQNNIKPLGQKSQAEQHRRAWVGQDPRTALTWQPWCCPSCPLARPTPRASFQS